MITTLIPEPPLEDSPIIENNLSIPSPARDRDPDRCAPPKTPAAPGPPPKPEASAARRQKSNRIEAHAGTATDSEPPQNQ